jgi:hypothetical protein
MKKSYKSLKKNNKFSSKINEIFYKFIDFRKKYEENFSQKYLDDIEYIKSQLQNFKNGATIFQFYRHIFNDIFYNNFSEKQLNNFIIDYFQLYKNKKLFLFLRSPKDNENYENIDFFVQLTPDIIENYEINLLCTFNSSKSYPIQFPENLKINSIYFIINSDLNSNNLLYLMIYYISAISNLKFGVKKIIFDKSFSTCNPINYGKTFLEFFVDNYKNRFRYRRDYNRGRRY